MGDLRSAIFVSDWPAALRPFASIGVLPWLSYKFLGIAKLNNCLEHLVEAE